MFHEMPDHESVLQNLKTILKPEGRILISEPKIHVPKKDFEETEKAIRQAGFRIIARPFIFFSRTLVLSH